MSSKGKRKFIPHPSDSFIQNRNGKLRADGSIGKPQVVRGRKLPVPFVKPLGADANGMGGPQFDSSGPVT